jgi:arylsulfatase A-like enzyme
MTDLIRGLVSFSRPAVLGADLERFVAQAKRPWFSVLFYSQPHFPYTSSSRYHEKSTVDGSDPALRFGKDVTRGEVRTEADRRQIDGLYRAALAETDAAIGDLLQRLRTSGELDDTIIVVTADHGEGLYECAACVGHGDNLVGMMSLRVPLVLRLPKARFPKAVPGVQPSYVSQLDVYPTLLQLLGVPVPPVQEGVPLVDREGVVSFLPPATVFFAETGEWLWPTVAVPQHRVGYPPITELAKLENDRIVVDDRYMPVVRAAKHRAAIYPPFKLVYRPDRAGATYALYDIDNDPFDERDVSRDHPKMAEYLKTALRRSVLRHASMIEVDGYFLTRPAPPPEEYY